jgi:hypothetical protein
MMKFEVKKTKTRRRVRKQSTKHTGHSSSKSICVINDKLRGALVHSGEKSTIHTTAIYDTYSMRHTMGHFNVKDFRKRKREEDLKLKIKLRKMLSFFAKSHMRVKPHHEFILPPIPPILRSVGSDPALIWRHRVRDPPPDPPDGLSSPDGR